MFNRRNAPFMFPTYIDRLDLDKSFSVCIDMLVDGIDSSLPCKVLLSLTSLLISAFPPFFTFQFQFSF